LHTIPNPQMADDLRATTFGAAAKSARITAAGGCSGVIPHAQRIELAYAVEGKARKPNTL
jgi:hypothetical protein